MKKVVLMISFCFCALFLWAQQQSFSISRGFYNQPTAFALTANNNILLALTSREGVAFSDRPHLLMLNSIGDVLWEYDEFASVGEINDIFVAEDGSIYVVGRGGWSCDFGAWGFLYQFSADGELLMSSHPDDGIIPATQIEVFDNGEIILMNQWALEKRTAQNEKIFRDYSPFYNIDHLHNMALYEENLIVGGYSTTEDNCGLVFAEPFGDDEYWDQCKLIDDTILNVVKREVNPFYFLMSNKAVYILNANNGGGSGPSSIPGANFQSMKAKDDFVYVLNQEVDQYSILRFKDFSLELVDTFAIDLLPHQSVFGFVPYLNNKFIVIGQNRSQHTIPLSFLDDASESSVFVRIYNTINNNELTNYDVGVSDIKLQTSAVISENNQCQLNQCETLVDILYPEVILTLTNYGNTPIESVKVNTRHENCEDCVGICHMTQTFSKVFENISLAPQESIDLSFGELLIRRQGSIDNHELCFWTSIPNNKIDVDISNDLTCIPFDQILDTENVLPETKVELTYLSGQNALRLTKSTGALSKGHLEIFDIMGRRMFQRSVTDFAQEVNISLSLPSNLYVAVFTSDEGQSNLKFVVQ